MTQPERGTDTGMPSAPGKLVIISGPSGVGKSTIMPLVRERFGDRLRMSISATTRPPRPGEVDGENYHFLSDDDFQRRLAAGEFLESVEVLAVGTGTGRCSTRSSLAWKRASGLFWRSTWTGRRGPSRPSRRSDGFHFPGPGRRRGSPSA